MIEVPCPECEVLIEAPDEMAGHALPCPRCGATVMVPVPPSAQVIDVHAEAVDEEEEEARRYEEDPFFNPSAQHPPRPGEAWGRTVHVERMGDGGGCCLGGCLAIALIVFFTLYGIMSFFFG